MQAPKDLPPSVQSPRKLLIWITPITIPQAHELIESSLIEHHQIHASAKRPLRITFGIKVVVSRNPFLVPLSKPLHTGNSCDSAHEFVYAIDCLQHQDLLGFDARIKPQFGAVLCERMNKVLKLWSKESSLSRV